MYRSPSQCLSKTVFLKITGRTSGPQLRGVWWSRIPWRQTWSVHQANVCDSEWEAPADNYAGQLTHDCVMHMMQDFPH